MAPRNPLPSLEGCVVRHSHQHAGAPISTHGLQEWNRKLVYEELEACRRRYRIDGRTEVTTQWLPPHLNETVQRWAWPEQVLNLPTASVDEIARTMRIAGGGLSEAGAENGSGDAAADGEDESFAPWTEAEADAETLLASPRVFVFPVEGTAAEGREPPPLDAAATTIATSDDAPDPAGAVPEACAAPAWPAPRRLPRPFVRFLTREQRNRTEVDKMLTLSNLPTSHDKAVAEARRNGLSVPEKPVPEGPLRDELMAAVFTAVEQLGRFLPRRDSSFAASRAPETPFLWESIHPQGADGRPAYNPEGTHYVQLWSAGAWRAVRVDTSLPLNGKGECVLPCTDDPRELWPMLLSKALYVLLGSTALGEGRDAGEGSPAGATAEDRFSLKFRGAVKHDGTSSLAYGGLFALAVQALTGWHPDVPVSLTNLARTQPLLTIAPPSRPPSSPKSDAAAVHSLKADTITLDEAFPAIDRHAGHSGSRNVTGAAIDDSARDDVDDETAARALVRHLIDDGMPCAPLEQFKYDEIYRATISAMLGKDPFLVNTAAKRWPRSPAQLRRAGGKKMGKELLRLMRAAGEARDRRVDEIRSEIFEPGAHPRLYALCAAVPPTELLGCDAAGIDRRGASSSSSRRASRRDSRRGSSRGSFRKSSSGISSSEARAQSNEPSDGASGHVAITGIACTAEAEEGEEGDESYASLSSDSDSSLGGSSKDGSVDLFDELGVEIPPRKKKNSRDETEAPADVGGAAVPLETVAQTPGSDPPADLTAVTPESSTSSLFGVANFIRSGIRFANPPSKEAKISPTLRCSTHVILAVGLRASGRPLRVVDAADLGRSPLGGDARTAFSMRRLEWLRGGMAGSSGEGSVGGGHDIDHESLGSIESAPPEPKLLVLWKDPAAYPPVDEATGEVPNFSINHPAMAKRNLRWITASAFIKANGGASMVSLVRFASRNCMKPQLDSSSLASSASLLFPSAEGASNLLTLHRHWSSLDVTPRNPPSTDASVVAAAATGVDPVVLDEASIASRGTAVPPLAAAPTFLRIITRPNNESGVENAENAKTEVATNVKELRDNRIKLMVAIEADSPAEMRLQPPLLSSLGVVELRPVPFLPPTMTEKAGDDKASANEEGTIGSSVGNGVDAGSGVEDEDDSSVNGPGSTGGDEQKEEGAEELGTSTEVKDEPPTVCGSLAWVRDWAGVETNATVAATETNAVFATETDADADACGAAPAKTQASSSNRSSSRSLVPSGCYVSPMHRGRYGSGVAVAAANGAMRLKLKPSVPDTEYAVLSRSRGIDLPNHPLPFNFAFEELLLPAQLTTPRHVGSSKTNPEVASDYFFQVRCDFPGGGLVHFACSEEIRVGSAVDVWGDAFAITAPSGAGSNLDGNASTSSPEATKNDELEGAEENDDGTVGDEDRSDRWLHAKSVSGVYPALDSTVAQYAESPRDLTGEKDVGANRENWAVLFRRKMAVLPEKGIGGCDGGRTGVQDVACRLKLHLSDPRARHYVRLVTYHEPKVGDPVTTRHPMLETPPLRWRSDVRPAESYVIIAVLEKPPSVALCAGDWTLSVLADAPISPLVSLEAPATPREVNEVEEATAAALRATAAAAAPTVDTPANGKASEQDSEQVPPAAVGLPEHQAECVVWKLPHSPMARALRWEGVYTPNKELRLLDEHLVEDSSAGLPSRNGRGPVAVSIRIEVCPQLNSAIKSYPLRLKIFKAATSGETKGLSPLAPLKNFNGINVPNFQQRAGMEQVADLRAANKIAIEMLPLPADESGVYLELSLDEGRMRVDEDLRGDRPFSALKIAPDGSAAGGTSKSCQVTVDCPKWRLIVLPTTAAPLTLSPDPAARDWADQVQQKWSDLRGGGGGSGDNAKKGKKEKPGNKKAGKDKIKESVDDSTATNDKNPPYFLKANSAALEERKEADSLIRANHKQFVARLETSRKNKREGSENSTADISSASSKLNELQSLLAGNSTTKEGDRHHQIPAVLLPEETVDRLYETSECQLMFTEDDRSFATRAAQVRAIETKCCEQMVSYLKAIRTDVKSATTDWATTRDRYRLAVSARLEAIKSLQQMADFAKKLKDGEKGQVKAGNQDPKKKSNKKKSQKRYPPYPATAHGTLWGILSPVQLIPISSGPISLRDSFCLFSPSKKFRASARGVFDSSIRYHERWASPMKTEDELEERMNGAVVSLENELNKREDEQIADGASPGEDPSDTLMQREFEERNKYRDEEETEDVGCEAVGGLLLAFSRAASSWVLRRRAILDDALVLTPMLEGSDHLREQEGTLSQDESLQLAMARREEPVAIYGCKTIERVVDEWNRSSSQVSLDETSKDETLEIPEATGDLLVGFPSESDLLQPEKVNRKKANHGHDNEVGDSNDYADDEGALLGQYLPDQEMSAMSAAQIRQRGGNAANEDGEEDAPLVQAATSDLDRHREVSSMSPALFDAKRQYESEERRSMATA